MTDENGSLSEVSLPRKTAVSPELLIVWAVGALLVPAIMLGVISVWVIAFAISVAWYFRVHLQKLNDDIDAVKDLKDIPYRRRFYGLCTASILSVSAAFILAYALYKFELIAWEGTQLRGLDAQLDVFNQLSAISFANLADPFEAPKLLLAWIGSLYVYFLSLAIVFIVVGAWWRYGLKVSKKAEGSSFVSAMLSVSVLFAMCLLMYIVVLKILLDYLLLTGVSAFSFSVFLMFFFQLPYLLCGGGVAVLQILLSDFLNFRES